MRVRTVEQRRLGKGLFSSVWRSVKARKQTGPQLLVQNKSSFFFFYCQSLGRRDHIETTTFTHLPPFVVFLKIHNCGDGGWSCFKLKGFCLLCRLAVRGGSIALLYRTNETIHCTAIFNCFKNMHLQLRAFCDWVSRYLHAGWVVQSASGIVVDLRGLWQCWTGLHQNLPRHEVKIRSDTVVAAIAGQGHRPQDYWKWRRNTVCPPALGLMMTLVSPVWQIRIWTNKIKPRKS